MKTSDFYFDLPEELIAQHPSGIRGQDRLMVLNRASGVTNANGRTAATDDTSDESIIGKIEHHMMDDLPDLIEPNTLMIFNNSRVRRARVYGIKETTGRETEFMFLNQIDKECLVWNVMVKNAKKQKPGMKYTFPDGTVGTIIEHEGNAGTEFRALKFDFVIDEDWFERNGHIPLPPYIRREDDDTDSERYQNVYAKETGSAACPTAGLHFTESMLERLKAKNIQIAYVTLHVGLGTFLPVREDNIEDHKMHTEYYTIPKETADLINQAKREGRTVLAVGTTSVRTLESAAMDVSDGVSQTACPDTKSNCPVGDTVNYEVRPGTSSTHIFMYPGYKFKIVDKIFTNFHTPESTLIMLVSAFAGKENIMNAYKKAVEEKYRFFSYGDCMLIR